MKFDASSLLNGLDGMADKIDAAVFMYANTAANNLESEAKKNAPWTDRTSMARKSLKGTVQPINNGYRIILAHGVNYGIWLELANEQKYAIVKPTIELKSTEVLKGFQGLMNKLSK